MRITVIGAGVIGLSCALELTEAGHDVTVIADRGPGDTVSAVAGAIWFPYSVSVSDASELELRSLTRFVELARRSEAAVASGSDDVTDDIAPIELRHGFCRERLDPPERSWVPVVTGVLGKSAVVEVDGGVEATLPMIMTSTYLAWLMDSCRIAGVRFRWKTVESLDLLINNAYNTERPEAIVVCGGIRGGELLGGDDEIYPVRGQVILFANGTGKGGDPRLTDWYIDDDDPALQTYVLPRVDEIVVGGVAEVGDWNGDPDSGTAEAILARAEEAVPALRDLPILGHGAGLRPGRSTLRLETVDPSSLPSGASATVGEGITVIAAYGHGGAGVTLSWGTAERVVELVGQIRSNSDLEPTEL